MVRTYSFASDCCCQSGSVGYVNCCEDDDPPLEVLITVHVEGSGTANGCECLDGMSFVATWDLAELQWLSDWQDVDDVMTLCGIGDGFTTARLRVEWNGTWTGVVVADCSVNVILEITPPEPATPTTHSTSLNVIPGSSSCVPLSLVYGDESLTGCNGLVSATLIEN